MNGKHSPRIFVLNDPTYPIKSRFGIPSIKLVRSSPGVIQRIRSVSMLKEKRCPLEVWPTKEDKREGFSVYQVELNECLCPPKN